MKEYLRVELIYWCWRLLKRIMPPGTPGLPLIVYGFHVFARENQAYRESKLSEMTQVNRIPKPGDEDYIPTRYGPYEG